LLAVRDRFGIKPLYCWRGPAGVAFASEIQQFLALPSFRARLDEARARDFLELGVTDHTQGTLWRDVTAVPPGACMVADVASGQCQLEQRVWYRLPATVPCAHADAVQSFAAALRGAVAAHVPERANAGVSLSGGLDSSAVACLTPQALPCLALAHDEPDVDESDYARRVAERTGSELTLVRLSREELPAALDAAVRAFDEPFPSLSVVAQWAVFREARRLGLNVLLTGQGADELLGGYPFLLGPQLAGLLRAGRFARLRSELCAQQRLHGRNAAAAARALVTAVMPTPWLPWLVRQGIGEPLLARARLAIARGGHRDLAARGLGQFRRDLLGAANLAMVLRYEDRTAMAHGIEARPPFLDRGVVESALAIAGDELVEGGVTKQPLRAALREQLPAAVLARTDKRGFPTPEAAWLKGPLASFVLASARHARERFPALVGEAQIDRIAGALAEPGPLRAPVWRVGALGAWAEAFGVEA
jgi:asparagine synthase (glutamine-hydrolysing)